MNRQSFHRSHDERELLLGSRLIELAVSRFERLNGVWSSELKKIRRLKSRLKEELQMQNPYIQRYGE